MTGPSDADVAAWLAQPGLHLVALDFDGTLAPIVDRPEDAALPEVTRPILERLASTHTLAIVTGRDVKSVDTLLRMPDVWRIGLHGHERCAPNGDIESHALDDETAHQIERRRVAAKRAVEAIEGAWIEDKSSGLAMHTRACSPDDEVEAQRRFTEVMVGAPLDLVRGKRVVEARPRGVHKGTALLALAEELGARSIFYAGDDVTDEDAFESLAGREGALTVKVGEGATRAGHRVQDPPALRRVLEALTARGRA
ncbi:MAG: trehalose-phosphatase [Deltaproteobacteria bacterium]